MIKTMPKSYFVADIFECVACLSEMHLLDYLQHSVTPTHRWLSYKASPDKFYAQYVIIKMNLVEPCCFQIVLSGLVDN